MVLNHINSRLSTNNSVGANVFIVGDAILNFAQNTISGEIYISNSYQAGRKKVGRKYNKKEKKYEVKIVDEEQEEKIGQLSLQVKACNLDNKLKKETIVVKTEKVVYTEDKLHNTRLDCLAKGFISSKY
jgi:hypothetical protein